MDWRKDFLIEMELGKILEVDDDDNDGGDGVYPTAISK
jgi:hypothetical protein